MENALVLNFWYEISNYRSGEQTTVRSPFLFLQNGARTIKRRLSKELKQHVILKSPLLFLFYYYNSFNRFCIDKTNKNK